MGSQAFAKDDGFSVASLHKAIQKRQPGPPLRRARWLQLASLEACLQKSAGIRQCLGNPRRSYSLGDSTDSPFDSFEPYAAF